MVKRHYLADLQNCGRKNYEQSFVSSHCSQGKNVSINAVDKFCLSPRNLHGQLK
jgi:hypothetical protein